MITDAFPPLSINMVLLQALAKWCAAVQSQNNFLFFSSGVLSLSKNKDTLKHQRTQRKLSLSVELRANKPLRQTVCETPDPPENHLKLLAFKVVEAVIGEAVNVVKQADTSHCVAEFQHQTNCNSTTYQDELRDAEPAENSKQDEETRMMGVRSQSRDMDWVWVGMAPVPGFATSQAWMSSGSLCEEHQERIFFICGWI